MLEETLLKSSSFRVVLYCQYITGFVSGFYSGGGGGWGGNGDVFHGCLFRYK